MDTCKEFERMITDFLENGLEDHDLKIFIAHMKTCESCKEELTIQYLITEGVQRLEDASAFDVNKELETKLSRAWHRVVIRKRLRFLNYFLEILFILVMIALIYWFLFLR